jgi:hypothetical protein
MRPNLIRRSFDEEPVADDAKDRRVLLLADLFSAKKDLLVIIPKTTEQHNS